MKIKKANDSALTNFEVLDFLRSRGAAEDSTRVIVSVAPSEVSNYLEQTVACNQTRESIAEFLKKSDKYKLVKAEILNIINIRPSSVVDIDPLISDCERRLGESIEEFIELVAEVFPAPAQMQADEGADGDREEIPDGKQVDTS
ncbi:hypothetical protein RHSIM_Rhsim04G0197700 [Rhododendron simsii]|uniref:DNA-directed RNA polymerase III subunit RPC9 n=1 Tax=Rhododendron simsii TaxID=118357 RepID=A0A834H448_RHOSS|nr:hypothetical protein RHSIM_Rhsim04G0197700 [Rhododendron simsii]